MSLPNTGAHRDDKNPSCEKLFLSRLISFLLVVTAVVGFLTLLIAASNAISHWWGGDRVTISAALTATVALLAFSKLVSLRRKLTRPI